MILIIGENEDAILYLRSRLVDARKEVAFPSLQVYRGRMGNEEAAIASVGIGLPLVAINVDNLLRKYEPYLVFNVGSVGAIKPSLHQGDVLIAERYYAHGIDYSGDGKNVYGQLNGLPPFFVADMGLCASAEKAAYEIGGHYVERGSLLSSDIRIYDEKPVFEDLQRRFAGNSRLTCLDNCSYAIALSCYLHNASLLTVKSVNYESGAESQRLNFRRKGLELMPFVGKVVSAVLLRNSKI